MDDEDIEEGEPSSRGSSEPGTEAKGGLARFVEKAEGHPAVTLLGLLSALVLSVGVVVGLVLGGVNAVGAVFGQSDREDEYELLESLSAGLDVAQFDAALGERLYAWTPEGSELTEIVYARDEYYVQVIVGARGVTEFFAVTSCSADFNLLGLNKAALSEFGSPGGVRYWIPTTNTANTFMFLGQYGGGGSNYTESYVGFNDACSMVEAEPRCSGQLIDLLFMSWEDPSLVLPCIAPNTIARTRPFAAEITFYSDCWDLVDGGRAFGESGRMRVPPADVCFTIGPDRIVTRTLPGPGHQFEPLADLRPRPRSSTVLDNLDGGG